MPDFDREREESPRKSGGEFQDSYYYDEEPEVQADDVPRPPSRTEPMGRRRPIVYPQPRRRYQED